MNGETSSHWHVAGRSDQLVQVMFVLDITQSMASEIVGVKQSIKEFMAAIREQQVRVEVGLTYFRDIMYPRQHPGVLTFANGSFTDDAREFIPNRKYLKLEKNNQGATTEISLKANFTRFHMEDMGLRWAPAEGENLGV